MTNDLVKSQTLDDSALRAEIDIKAAPDKVYAAWTQREIFEKWFGPRQGGSLQVDHFDCSVGGRFDVTMIFADGDRVRITGDYQELNPPKKIAFTWQWSEGSAMSNETVVTVALEPSDIGTHLTLTHEGFISTKDRDDHQEGWAPLLQRLASLLPN